MRIIPSLDLIIVKRDKEEEVTKGGIIIPQNAQKKSTVGIVVAVGKGKVLPNGRRVEPEVKVGDKVLFGEWTGQEVMFEDELCLGIKEENIYGVLEEE